MQDDRTISLAGRDEDRDGLGLSGMIRALQDPEPPTIPGYRITRLVHAGGMGAVWLAAKAAKVAWFELDVALKTMKVSHPSRESIKRFQEECALLRRVDWHPAIAKIYDAGEYTQDAASLPYYAMQYVPGEQTLRRYVQEWRPTIEELVSLAAEVCSALQAAHDKGVAHLDVKPDNILIDPARRPVVIDFGIARFGHNAGDQRSSGPIGTPEYMSPEQAVDGPPSSGSQSDVYSLGVTLYELVNGRRPYDMNRADPSWPTLIRATPPAPMRDDIVGLDAPLKRIMLRALEKRREDRFDSAEAFRRALLGWLKDRQWSAAYAQARRETVWWGIRVWLSRRLVAALAITFVAALLLSESLVLPLVYLTPLNSWWLELATRMTAPVAPANTHTVIVAINEQTDMEEIAGSAEISGVKDSEPPTWRGLHGAFVERLAAANPKVIAFDFTMKGERPGDERFLRGVRASQGIGVPVIIVADTWEVSDQGPSGLSHSLLDPALHWAPATVSTGHHPASLDLAVQHPGKSPIPSLSLLAFTLAEKRGRPAISFDEARVNITLRYSNDERLASFPISHFESGGAPSQSGLDRGFQEGDVTAVLDLPLPRDDWFEHATIPYQRAFEMTPEQRRQAFDGKTVMIANLREGVDPIDVGARGSVPGAYLHVAAIDALRRGAVVRQYLPNLHPWAAAAAAALGVALGAQFWRRHRMLVGLLAWALASALTFGACILIFKWALVALDPWVLSLAMLLAGALAVCVRNLAEPPGGPGHETASQTIKHGRSA